MDKIKNNLVSWQCNSYIKYKLIMTYFFSHFKSKFLKRTTINKIEKMVIDYLCLTKN